ncbi:hypothetical protein D3C86_1499750 [compost metagenome]
MVQVHQHGHVLLGAADAELHAVDQAVEHVRGVEFAIDELVAHAGPVGFLARRDLDAVLLVQAERGRHDHRGAVRQRDEADADFGFLRGIGAGRPGAAAHQRIYQRHHAGPGDGGQHAAPALAGWGCVGDDRDHGGGQGLGVFEARGHGDGSEKRKRRPDPQPAFASLQFRTPLSRRACHGRQRGRVVQVVSSGAASFVLRYHAAVVGRAGDNASHVPAPLRRTSARKSCRKSLSGGGAWRVRPGTVRTVGRGGAWGMDRPVAACAN